MARGRKRKSEELPPRFPEGEKETKDAKEAKEAKKAGKPSFQVEHLDELVRVLCL